MNNIVTTVETITPETAKKYLELNTVNRNVRPRAVDALARDIVNGDFVLTHQGIAFDEAGNLVDGQHRLMACVKAGIPIEVMVSRNVPRVNAAHVDLGNKRITTDVFALTGEFSDNPAFRNKHTTSTVKRLVYFGYNANLSTTADEIRALIYAFENELEFLYKASISRKRTAPATVNSAALAALICKEEPEDIYKFFSVFIFGDSTKCSGYNAAAAYIWANHLLEARAKGISLTGTFIYSGTQNAIWQFIHGENSRIIRPPKTFRYPVFSAVKAVLDPQLEEEDN